MTTGNAAPSVLLIGKSQLVLSDTTDLLDASGYRAEATNDFAQIAGRFDPRRIDLVVFGGQVPADRRAELQEEISQLNRSVIFVNGLAGIPGLLVEQVQGAFASQMRDSHRAPSYSHGDRTVRLHLPGPAGVTVTAWWQTSFVPPDPKSDSGVLLDQRLDGGEHTVAIPDDVPTRAAFVTARVDANTYAFSIAAES